MKKRFLLLFLILNSTTPFAQNNSSILAGPMLGYVELRTANIWCEVSPQTQKVSLTFKKNGTSEPGRSIVYKGSLGSDFNPVSFHLTGLDFNTTYQYEITAVANHQPSKVNGRFTTTDLWQYRKNIPDFIFLAGSCAYFNEPAVDRKYSEFINPQTPAIPYGADSTIFETMAKEKAAFNLWLGDNWYYREVDYGSGWGMNYRASVTRKLPILRNLMKAMPQLGIWDDHDYGPNDSDKSYHLKQQSLEIFKNYWANPSFGQDGEGIYTKFSYCDVEFFLMDDRWLRSSDKMLSTINNQPNPNKRMWGQKQMDWLKNALSGSLANFKIIVTGSQTLNPVSPWDCLQSYPIEFNELMDFLNQQKINGVLFLTGDRHHSEIIKYDRPEIYPLYDITSSPLTSGVGKVSGKEVNNDARIQGTLVEAQNYARITVNGPPRERKLKVEFVGIKGEKLGEWSIGAADLRAKQ
jgi:alkaline phosphatase D